MCVTPDRMRLDGLDINKEIKLSILFGDEIDKVEEEQKNKTKQNRTKKRRDDLGIDE